MSRSRQKKIAKLKQEFLRRVPDIERYARHVFRRCHDNDREELVAETVAHVWLFFVRLSDRGKDPTTVFHPVLRFSALLVKNGRRVGGKQNSRDLCHRAKRDGLRICSLEDRDHRSGSPWKDVIAETRAFSPADTAAARIDIEAWLRSQSARNQMIAKALAVGERPSALATRFHISCGRISQLRNELRASWEQFQLGIVIEKRSIAVATP